MRKVSARAFTNIGLILALIIKSALERIELVDDVAGRLRQKTLDRISHQTCGEVYFAVFLRLMAKMTH